MICLRGFWVFVEFCISSLVKQRSVFLFVCCFFCFYFWYIMSHFLRLESAFRRRRRRPSLNIEFAFKTVLGLGLSRVWRNHDSRLEPCIVLRFLFSCWSFWLQLAPLVVALIIPMPGEVLRCSRLFSKLPLVTGPRVRVIDIRMKTSLKFLFSLKRKPSFRWTRKNNYCVLCKMPNWAPCRKGKTHKLWLIII